MTSHNPFWPRFRLALLPVASWSELTPPSHLIPRRFKGTKTDKEIAKFNSDLKSNIETARNILQEASKLNCALAPIDMGAVKAV